MPEFSQTNCHYRVYTPLGPDVLLLENLNGEEAISQPFEFQLEMLSLNDSISASDLIRKPVHIEFDLAEGGLRVIHGWVSQFIQRGRRHYFTQYYARIRPWPWFLSLWKDCRIFQNLTVRGIIELIFSEHNCTDFRFNLYHSYPKREYCVQYRESCFDFISRLLEQEGIFYYFEHTAEKHVLVLTDDNAGCTPCPGQASARVSAIAESVLEDDVVTELEHTVRAGTGQVTLNDYNFKNPSQSLKVNVAGQDPEEIYDYPGEYEDRDDGDRYARIRLEEQEMPDTIVRGVGNCRAFIAGYKFDLKDHYRRDFNTSYIITRLRISVASNAFQTDANPREDYTNRFETIPASVPHRPLRLTPVPVIAGVQTAVVVGPKKEEIYSDNYGRVKVQFNWDRKGTKDEKSSCWLRVSQEWAGKNWGAVYIPRIGQEVVVDFLEGDPDKPIVTGRVYNAEQMPPYSLPANQTQSGVKTRSSKGGGTSNYNEFRFEDLKDNELILLHAEKDLQTEVEHDETRTVGHDRTTTITNDETKTITTGNESIELQQGNQTTKVDLGSIDTEAMQTITLKVGQSSIVLDQGGVTIKGLQIQIEGQILAQVKGDGILILKGDITLIN
jgi:type VI secretion system secreted protein VgrG